MAVERSPGTTGGQALHSGWLEVDGLRMHAVSGGEGTPVVLVHGYGVSGSYMLPLARVLASSSFTVFAPDLPGQGLSDPARQPPSIRYLADSLGSWIEAAGLERPPVVANSMGCQVVTDLAARRPDLVGPMVLTGPTVDPARRRARHQLVGMLRDSRREPLSLVGLAVTDSASVSIRPLLAAARSALADRIEERLPLVEQPAVVVYGGADGFLGREWAEQVAELMPHGRLVVVPGEPHAVHYTRPDLVAEILHELLIEVGERDERPGSRDRLAALPSD